MKLVGVLLGLCLMAWAGLAANVLVYSPDKDFEPAASLAEAGYTVSTVSHKFGLETARKYDAILVNAGINDIPPEMYVVLREYARTGGRVVLALDPESIMAYSVFEQASELNPNLCYSEPVPVLKLQHCMETRLYQEEANGRAYSLISKDIPSVTSVVLEGTPTAYIGDKKVAVRTLVGDGQILVAGFPYSNNTKRFFIAGLEGKSSKQVQEPVNPENVSGPKYKLKPAPIQEAENNSMITGKAVALIATQDKGNNTFIWVLALVAGALVLGYIVVKPKSKTKETQPQAQISVPEQMPAEQRVPEKDEFVY